MNFLVNRYDSIDIIKVRNQIRTRIFRISRIRTRILRIRINRIRMSRIRMSRIRMSRIRMSRIRMSRIRMSRIRMNRIKMFLHFLFSRMSKNNLRLSRMTSQDWKISWIRQWRAYADLISIVLWSRMTIFFYLQVSTFVENVLERVDCARCWRCLRWNEKLTARNVEDVWNEMKNWLREMLKMFEMRWEINCARCWRCFDWSRDVN